MSLKCNYVTITHTEDTKSFPTVSAATLTTFMRMIKSQTYGKGMYCTLDFEQLQYQSKYRPFCFTPLGSFQAGYPGGL